MLVGKLTEEQKDWLIGPPVQLVTGNNWYFYPVQDGSNEKNWVISVEEIQSSSYPQNEFVKTLPLIEWIPPYVTPLDQENYFDQFFKN